MLDIAQPQTFGATYDTYAGTNGLAAANDAVTNWTSTTATDYGSPSVAQPVLATHDAQLGSTFKITQEGLWIARFRGVNNALSGPITVGLSLDAIAADLSIIPTMNARTLDIWSLGDETALDNAWPVYLEIGPFVVTRAMAKDPTLALVRLLATARGAPTAPAAGALGTTPSRLTIFRVCNIPRATT